MLTSQRIRSGSCSRAWATPSALLIASMTSKPCCSSASRIISRSHSSSSMTRILLIQKSQAQRKGFCSVAVVGATNGKRPANNFHLILFARLHRHVARQRGAGVNLARPVVASFRLLHDLLVVGDPARHPADGDNHREHFQDRKST